LLSADIGYHYTIDPTGRIWEGRPVQYQGAHVKMNNEHNQCAEGGGGTARLGAMACRSFPLWVPGALATGALAFASAASLWLLGITQGLWPLLVTCVISAAVTARFTRVSRDGARGVMFAVCAALGSGLAYGAPMLFVPEAEFGRGYMAVVCLVLQALPAAMLNVGAALVVDACTRRARRKGGCCVVCRYDLAGLPAGSACPECAARAES
jgi:hypothetical protein